MLGVHDSIRTPIVNTNTNMFSYLLFMKKKKGLCYVDTKHDNYIFVKCARDLYLPIMCVQETPSQVSTKSWKDGGPPTSDWKKGYTKNDQGQISHLYWRGHNR